MAENINDEEQVTLDLEDGTSMVCNILAIYPCGDNMYCALQSADDEESDVFICRYNDIDDENFEILPIEDDDEFEAASDAFDELLDAQEYDAMFGDEDDDQ